MDVRTVHTSGVDLRVVMDGPQGAPVLALINVALSNLEVYTPMLPRLQQKYRVLRHDWRGTGKSTGGDRAAYNFDQYADDLAAIFDVLGIEQAVVCGCAYGARTAARFALRHPDRTRLLALFDVSLAHPVDQGRQRDLVVEARRLRDEAGLSTPRVQESWFAHEHDLEARRSVTAHVRYPDPTEEMAGCKIPTLVACGRQDENLGEAECIARLMPRAEFQIMEMTSHPAVMSRPDLANDLLLDFMARHLG